MEGVLGADPLEEATNVMAGHRDGIEHSADGAFHTLAEDGKYTDDSAADSNREGHGAVEVSLGCPRGAGPPAICGNRGRGRPAPRLQHPADGCGTGTYPNSPPSANEGRDGRRSVRG